MKLQFEYGIRVIAFNLIYRKRRTMTIEVEPTGEFPVAQSYLKHLQINT